MAENTTRLIRSAVADGGVNHTDVNGLTTRTGGGAVTAFDTVLVAVGGCCCAVLEGLLKRDGHAPSEVTAEVEGTRGEEPPRPYVAIAIRFQVRCPGVGQAEMESYIDRAEKSCPVIQSLACKVTPTVTLL